MRKVLHRFVSIPLDVKVFILSAILIIGILFFPDNPKHVNLFTTYIVFCFISIAISAFYMTYVADSKYNFFRKASSKIEVLKIVLLYVFIVVMISYVLAVTEWFLFLL